MPSKMAMCVGSFKFLAVVAVISIIVVENSLTHGETEVNGSENLIIFTVATDETDGYKRFVRSVDKNGLSEYLHVLGMGEEWRGGDVRRYAGGGQKVRFLKDAMEKYKDNKDLVIMFVDSYDVVFTAGADEILKRFQDMDARVVFSAEVYLWPDKTLHNQYPQIEKGLPYLNSGMFMGYAPEIWKTVTHREITNQADDQLYYTKIYLDPTLREELQMKLDNLAMIFQNLNGVQNTVTLMFEGKNSMLQNVNYGTVPVVIHGNGGSKMFLDHLGNYLVNSWTPEKGCLACKEDTVNLAEREIDNYPDVLMAIFVEQPTPFIKEFFKTIADLSYPKKKIDIFIHNSAPLHAKDVSGFLDDHSSEYNSVREVPHTYGLGDQEAKNKALNYCLQLKCQYYFAVDADARLTNPDTLKLLIEQNRGIIAPLLVRPGKLWSNFWGALSDDGFYARSDDYIDIVKGNKRGVWNVPYMGMAYLAQSDVIKKYKPSYIYGDLDSDMAFCRHLREQGVFMHVTNTVKFGHQIDSDNFATYARKKHPDMYQIFDNPQEWEARYIHPLYLEALNADRNLTMPCQDVYSFPLMSETFAKHLIEEAESFGKWSDGTNNDPRLAGGYENVPTRDIHMKQIDFETQWLHFLKEYVCPIQEKLYPGYYSKAHAIMNFMVRYRPDEQPALRAHHDASTFTINVALNKHGVDYEGGGARFIRYNCSVVGLEVGYSLMHPGRLTHFHEGLRTISGTRYIMVSFIDP
ncbi:procollagen-lysine,2-oxoglutarate 5-dioxygenase 1-like [Ptychodera flava]|uniref:procollagen-lysine,2-oxoglutarate 5-dioxygenase 1-like n=1 Tax=Ptychodera flava TaxID=63121 RepID=UPI00396A0DBD